MQLLADYTSYAVWRLANMVGYQSAAYYDPCVEVADGVYIGSLATVQSTALPDIGFIVNLSGQTYDSAIPVCTIMMGDAPITLANVAAYVNAFNRAFIAINNARKKGHRVLVHCMAGVNRSATAIGYYLIMSGYTLDEMYAALGASACKRGVRLLTNPTFRTFLETAYATRRVL